MIEDISLRVTPKVASDITLLIPVAAKEKGLKSDAINDLKILRRSIDARQSQIKVNLNVRVAYGNDKKVAPLLKPVELRNVSADSPTIIIVGAGPAGLFAALKAIELGIKPIVIERGKDVVQRRIDIASISKQGVVDPNSNYCFGEGGAGAYSDGKLFTRSKKRGNVDSILQLLVQHGANENILIDSHPHIGSDKLPEVIKNIRENIIIKGGEVRFQTMMENLIISDQKVLGVKTNKGEIRGDAVILATGHSARDVYKTLFRQQILIEAKPLAIGVRLEHPQHLIDQLQYHSKEGRGKYLPAAEYSFVTQVNGRGVYSFCMCPGGVVVPAMSAKDELVVNGMSASARASQWANSGMVVEIHPGDVPGYENGALAMLNLQEDLEKKFYLEANKSLNAPAQRMTDFVEGKASEGELPRSSYPNGIHNSRLDLLLPVEIATRLQKGFIDFNKKCKGFLTDKAVLIGLESRTSSPIRIPRDKEHFEHLEIENLFPAGEGAGYAGGIVSAAIDGQRCVEAFYSKLLKNK